MKKYIIASSFETAVEKMINIANKSGFNMFTKESAISMSINKGGNFGYIWISSYHNDNLYRLQLDPKICHAENVGYELIVNSHNPKRGWTKMSVLDTYSI